jgi:hypothetical protein
MSGSIQLPLFLFATLCADHCRIALAAKTSQLTWAIGAWPYMNRA